MAAGKNNPLDKESSRNFPAQFVNGLTRVAVAQMCQSVGYRRTRPSALQALTTVTTLYLRSLTEAAAASAARCGRSQCNILDIVLALEDRASPNGFPGASDVNGCLFSSSILNDLSKFVATAEDLPFSKPFPRRMNNRLEATIPSAGNSGSGGGLERGSEIPLWLPDFPDARSVCETSMETKELRWEETWRQRGKVEEESDGPVKKMLKEENKRRRMLFLRRDRVRFKIGVGKVKGKGQGKSKMRLKKNVVEKLRFFEEDRALLTV